MLGDPEHHEFGGLDRCDAHLDDQQSLVDRFGRIRLGVALHIERLIDRLAEQCARARPTVRRRKRSPSLPDGAVAGELGEGAAIPQLAAPAALPFEEVREQALVLAAKDPATAAVVLRQWLSANAPAAAALPH